MSKLHARGSLSKQHRLIQRAFSWDIPVEPVEKEKKERNQPAGLSMPKASTTPE
jgi:hypothetical protein